MWTCFRQTNKMNYYLLLLYFVTWHQSYFLYLRLSHSKWISEIKLLFWFYSNELCYKLNCFSVCLFFSQSNKHYFLLLGYFSPYRLLPMIYPYTFFKFLLYKCFTKTHTKKSVQSMYCFFLLWVVAYILVFISSVKT